MILAMMAAASLAMQTGEARPAQRARANLNQYFSTDDYPETALARRAEGTVGFRLDIGADGSVTRCTVTHSSDDAALDAATCSILLGRVRYDPARDAQGRAIAGKDVGRVTWRLPPDAGRPFVRMRTVSVLRANGAGELECSVTVDGTPQRDVAPRTCGTFSGSGIDYVLRQARAPVEATMISVEGPVSADLDAVGAEERGLGVLQYDLVMDLDIGPDGRVTACRTVRNDVPTFGAVERPADACEYKPHADSPMFEPSADRASRHARYRIAMYVKGVLEGPPPAGPPAPSPVPRP